MALVVLFVISPDHHKNLTQTAKSMSKFCFVLDTSASMNRLFSKNLSYFEAAKAAIEHFVKFDMKRPNRENRFILATYDSKNPIKSSEGSAEMLDKLRYLKALDFSDAGSSFSALFDFLNAVRVCDGGDVPGLGRYPAAQDSTLIFWLTDGTAFSSNTGVTDRINIPGGKTPGFEWFHEPFRWEQRLYTIVLGEEYKNNQIGALTESMGGQTWKVSSMNQLSQCIDNCFELRHPQVPPYQPICHIQGVTVKVIVDSEPPCPLFLYANRTVTKFFPLPEAFWPDQFKKSVDSLVKFPPRHAQPTIHISTKDELCPIYDGFPCERLSMEQIHFCQLLLKRPRNTCWVASMENSHSKPGLGLPFGFFKVTKNGQSVNFYILPYNFKKLFSLLSSGSAFQPNKLPKTWLSSFLSYLRDTPCYYWMGIKQGMESVKLGYLWPSKLPFPGLIQEISTSSGKMANMARSAIERFKAIRNEMSKSSEISGIISNVFDIELEDLNDQFNLRQLKAASNVRGNQGNKLSHATQEELDLMHMVPIAEMGDYSEAIKSNQSPRNPFEDEDEAREREKTLFGNPYRKLPKKSQAIQKVPDSPGQDSVMNEADEEASHGFENDVMTNPQNPTRSRRNIQTRAKIPQLYRKPLLSIPDFSCLKWNDLKNTNYTYSGGIGDLHVESVVKELENVSTPTHLDSAPTSDRLNEFYEIEIANTSIGASDEDTIMAENHDDEIVDQTPPPVTFKTWTLARKDVHSVIATWPDEFNLENAKKVIQASLNPLDPDYKSQQSWVKRLAERFDLRELVDFVDDKQ